MADMMVFDKSNKQIEHRFMARSIETNKLIVGWVVIEQPWYSNPRDWTYYMYSNEYGSGGFCGGASDLGLRREIVDSDTIEIYNQISRIKFNQSIGIDTQLLKEFDAFDEKLDNVIAIIRVEDDIPYQLWSK